MLLPDWPWSEVPAALMRERSAQLLSYFEADRPIYLLIDPLLGDVQGIDADRPKYSIDPRPIGLLPEQAPYLLELEGRHDSMLDASLKLAFDEHLKACAVGSGAFRIGGWLQTHGDDGLKLARQLGALFHALGAPQSARYLRLADRRVLGLLQLTCGRVDMSGQMRLPAVNWGASLKGVAAWVKLDLGFDLTCLCGEPGDSRPRRLALEPAHWQLMQQAEAINRTLIAWQQLRHPLPPDAVLQVMAKVDNARQRGIADAQEQAAYAVEALRYPAFERWPLLRENLSEAQAVGASVQDLLNASRTHWSSDLQPRA